MPIAKIDDRKLFYAARALERRPALLLIHGAGGSHLDWPPQLRRFEGLGTCAIDLPGHGRSSAPARSRIGEYAEDVLCLAEAIDLPPFISVGHSMGGAIALEMALRRPDLLVGLVLVGTGAKLKVNEALLNLAGRDHTAAVQHMTVASWGPEAAPEVVTRSSQLMLSCDPVTLQMDFSACNDFDVMVRLDGIETPTLVLVGTEDRMTPLKHGRYLADHIPGAELISIAGAGHMLPLERPNEVAGAINRFFRRQDIL